MSSSAELSLIGSSTEWGVALQGVIPGGSPWGASTGWGVVLQGIRGSSMGVFPGGSPQAGVLLGVCHGVFHMGVLHWVLPGVLHGSLHGFSGRLCRTCLRAVLQRSKETSGIYKPIPFSYCLKVEYINTLTIAVCPQCGLICTYVQRKLVGRLRVAGTSRKKPSE